MRRHPEEVEAMDLPDCDPVLLNRTYAQFPLVNRAVGGWKQIYARQIAPVLARGEPARLLDIGCGGGDIALQLARWALRDGYELDVRGIDADERAIAFARRAAMKSPLPAGKIEFARCTSADLVRRGEVFDVVISNHLLHHLGETQLRGILADTQALATGLGLHADIRRSRRASLLFGAATLPLAGTSLIRRDGLASIRRSYIPMELVRRVPAGWQVHTARPFRNLLVYRPVRA